MRLAAGLTYRGDAYFGWQRQAGEQETVQQRVEEAFSAVSNTSVKVHCAGRTDRGVHAIGQIIHFDVNAQIKRRPDQWILGVNARLPSDIRVQWVTPVPDEFHARFSALHRWYRYIIDTQPNASAPFDLRAYAYRFPLNSQAMNAAMRYWVGKHDFSSFRSSSCGAKTPIRTIHLATLRQIDSLLVLDFKANAFLHHMVRNMVGALMWVGRGREDPIWAQTLLTCKDRCMAPKMAPACGLYFMEAAYPFDLPQVKRTPWLSLLDEPVHLSVEH
jgi:tRNA pseudouridine38-40 synthase